VKDPRLKKSSFIKPRQKGESIGFSLSWDNDFKWRYLFFTSSWHTPCSFSSLKSYLHSKHLFFFISSTSTPRPPWSLGRHMMFQRVSLYFFLWPSLCQKNLDLKKSSLFLTPFGISKKESINIGRLVNTELISTNLSP
jgi:hypothetical protein